MFHRMFQIVQGISESCFDPSVAFHEYTVRYLENSLFSIVFPYRNNLKKVIKLWFTLTAISLV